MWLLWACLGLAGWTGFVAWTMKRERPDYHPVEHDE